MVLIAWTLLAAQAREEAVELPRLFSDNMILQRRVPVPIWGTAKPGATVTVVLGKQTHAATAGADGRWIVKLDPLEAGGPLELRVNELTFRNVLVGDVWLCSGQSNMEYGVETAARPKEEIAAARFPKIRLFTVGRAAKEEPQSDVKGKWQECSPETVAKFSAAGYFFGRELHAHLDVPIGLICSSWSGTPIEAWMSEPLLASDSDTKAALDRWKESLAAYPKAVEAWEKRAAQWEKDVQSDSNLKRPKKPSNPKYASPTLGRLFNGMIHPLIPFAMKGVIWYQGESNTAQAASYEKKFSALIQDWRSRWGRGNFPFLFVQLANFMPKKPQPGDSDWARLREAQLRALSVPTTAMVVAIDIGDEKDIHPKNKQEVGRRLALAARALAYGETIVYSGPIFESMKIEEGRIRLSFGHVGGGLMGSLKGFAIAGDDKKFVWAKAEIEGDTVVVRSDDVPNPKAVRYAWADSPDCGLYNKEGLPASPFRTDP